jgi:hypothetical protein
MHGFLAAFEAVFQTRVDLDEQRLSVAVFEVDGVCNKSIWNSGFVLCGAIP